jgi:hypothetical protein
VSVLRADVVVEGVRPVTDPGAQGGGRAFAKDAVFRKVEEDHGATPLFMIVVDEGWRESILCIGMYGWAADWLLAKLAPHPASDPEVSE